MIDEVYPRLFLEVIPSGLKLSGVDLSRLLEDLSRHPTSNATYGQLIRSVYQQNPDSDIGLTFGSMLWPATLCDFSRALMTAPTLDHVFELTKHYHYIVGASYFPILIKKNNVLRCCLTFPYKSEISDCQKRFCCEALFLYLQNMIRETCEPQFKASRVQFEYSPPAYIEQYHRYFNTDMEFKASISAIDIPLTVLHRNIRSSNPLLHNMYFNKCMDHWKQTEYHSDFVYRAVTCLMTHHPDSFNCENLAKRLNISVRGLQKRLSKQDSSFSRICCLARRELAKVYLFQENHSIDFVAEQLGFQTSSGLRKFFKSEFRLSPTQFIEFFN